MTAYAPIITHSPEQVVQWRQIALSNPGRVARTLALRPGRTTREGDTQGDIYPALEVVKEFSMQGRNNVESKGWADLVDAGIADVLCKNVCEMVTFMQYLPNMPMDLLEKVKKEIQSPYYRPLEVLCNAACCFQYPPTRTDKKIIAALRKNWSEMMDRIWNEPENTLGPEDSHILERMVVAQIVVKIIITDPTFISIFYEPSDLTVQIVARHWKHSLKSPDTILTASLLNMLLEPAHPRHLAYVRTNGLESATPAIISKIFLGVGPTALASKPKQAKALMTAFADHLIRLSGRAALAELDFLACILTEARKDRVEPELAMAVFKSTPFWNAMFRLLKKSAKPAPAGYQGPGEADDPETEKKHRLRIIAGIVGVAASTLHEASFEHPRECEPLARIWANENFFGALEESIELLVAIPGMTMQLTRLTAVLQGIVEKGTPALLRLFRAQFPRWHILGTLIRHDAKRQQVAGPPPVPVSVTLAPPESSFWDHGVWQSFQLLQAVCVDLETACGKRGCENANAGTVRCRCEVVTYCSEACRNKDTKDHSLVCGWMGVLMSVNAPAMQAPPPPVQSNKEKKKRKTQDSVPDTVSQSNAGLEELD